MIQFLVEAAKTAGNAPQASPYTFPLMMVLLVAVFYFMLIRPQNKRAKQHQELVASLEVGTEIVTASGMLGKIVSIKDNFITLEIGNGVEIIMQRNAVSAILPKDTIKNITSSK